MKASLFIAIAALLCLAGVSASLSVARHELEPFTGTPMGWTRQAPLADEDLITFTVAVKQTNVDLLEETLLRVSDPDHADFNKLMTWEEVNDFVAPSIFSIAAVYKWLASAGVDVNTAETTPNKDFITVTIDAATAEKLLGVRYHYYVHSKSGHVAVRLHGAPTAPANVVDHVDFVGPSQRFPVIQQASRGIVKKAHQRGLLQFGSVTPAFLRNLYNTGDAKSAAPKNHQSCSSFLGQYYSPSDLQSFFQQYDTDGTGQTPNVIGPNDGSNPGVEASLDIQYIMAMGNGVNTTFWSTSGQQPHNPGNEPFLAWLTNVAATSDEDVPVTFSVSYGDNEPSVNYAYALRVNTEFKKAGMRGITIFFASGDGGVSGGQSGPCSTFVPTWPASSPWVTTVGGTTSSSPEVAASFSSGGFSNYFSRPAYQDAAVAQYFKVAQNLPASNLYNHTGAGVPDVSAQSENFAVVIDGFPNPVDGTSCASPTFSGVWSLLTDLRMQHDKKPLGYINQIIYKNADKFNDITSGNNPGCGTNGFQAAAGWDPITGLGTPDYKKLSDLVLSLP